MNKAFIRKTILPLWTVAIAVLALVLYLSEERRGALDEGRVPDIPEYQGTGLSIDEVTARRLFSMSAETFRFDPTCYYRYLPHVDETFKWPEHPRGEWTRRTNEQGWREDSDDELEDYDVRVLVAGDSHTDGACFNDESFPHVLEGLMQAREDQDASQTPRRVGVQNSGIVGYSFHNHLGVLRMHIDQDLDVFVVAVYGGNDFAESIRPQHYLRETRPSARRTGYWSRIEDARRVSDQAVAQALNQVLYFDEQPEEIDVALDAVSYTAEQIRDLCVMNGVRLIYVYIPTAFDAPWPELGEARERAMKVLGIDEARMSVSDQLRDSLFTRLDELGVTHYDLEPVLRAEEGRCYWKKDLHINLLGHKRIAEALDGWIASGAGEIGAGAVREDGHIIIKDDQDRVLAEGDREDGVRVGLWREWYANGELRSSGEMQAGQREGEWTWWYPDGGVQRNGEMADGRPSGVWRDWHVGGAPAQWSSYSDGTPWGIWIQWRPAGTVMSHGAYVDGVRVGEWWTYRADGSPEVRALLWNGKALGEVERFPVPR